MTRAVDPVLAPWNGTTEHARSLQREWAQRVELIDRLPPLRRIAGVDVGFEDRGAITRAAAVLLDADTLTVQAHALVRMPTSMPYVPGLLSFRELPALMRALAQLSETPDLVFVDGQGIAHPRRFGIAAHLGIASGLPAIGVAKSILIGTHAPLDEPPGTQTALFDGSEIIGTLLRSKRGCRPLIISPGHRISHATAVELVLRCITRYRLPEPTRLADRLASMRAGSASC